MEWNDNGVSLQMDQTFYLAEGNGDEKSEDTSSDTVDISAYFSGTGAEANGGSLEKVDQLVDSYGKAGFNIGKSIGIYAFGIALIVGFIFLMLHAGNMNKRGESKERIAWTIIAGVGLFAVGSIVILAQAIGTNLF